MAFGQISTMLLLMCVGFLCVKFNVIDIATNKKLTTILIYIISPSLIFMSYQKPFNDELLEGLFLTFIFSLVSFIVVILVTHLIYRKKNNKNYKIERLSCVYSNCGFMGLPLINGIFGSQGVLYITAYITMFNLFVWTHGIITINANVEVGISKLIWRALKVPVIPAALSGLVFFFAEITLPAVLANPLTMLGNMNTPIAMIVAGVSIYGTNVLKVLKDVRIYVLCFLRLIIMPLATIFVLSFFTMPDLVRAVVVTAAACPGAAMTIVLAQNYDEDFLFASEVFATSTILSMATIPFILFLL